MSKLFKKDTTQVPPFAADILLAFKVKWKMWRESKIINIWQSDRPAC